MVMFTPAQRRELLTLLRPLLLARASRVARLDRHVDRLIVEARKRR